MKLHRFIEEAMITSPQVGDRYEITSSDMIHQMDRVLRMKEGSELILCDNRNTDYRVIIKEATKKSFTVEILSAHNIPPMRRSVMVCVALVKGSRFDETLLHLVEVGVTSIVPILTERTEKKDLNHERVIRILKEASEQSGRGTMPILHPLMKLPEALVFAKSKQKEVLWCDTDLSEPHTSEGNSVALFIGPEGGFTPAERELAKSHSALFVSLGQTILRAETAALVASYGAVHGTL